MKPSDLSLAMFGALAAIAATRGTGHDRKGLDGRSVRALEGRGLVEERGSPSLSRVPRLFATLAGHDLIAADCRERGIPDAPLYRVTPSKRSPWEGAAYDGSRFTADQVFELDRRGIDHRRAPLIMVSVEVPEAELYVPLGQARPSRRYACPRVGMCRRPGMEGRVAVLTPSGDWAAVEPDGSDPQLYAAKRKVVAPYGRENWV